MPKSNPPFRLPDTIRPMKYNLTIEPDLVAQIFSGTLTIDIKIEKKTNKIYLHSKDLVMGVVFIREIKKTLSPAGRANKKESFIPKITYKEKNETIILELPKKIEGYFEISIAYTGIIHEDLRGFYISKYQVADKSADAESYSEAKEELIGATQFEAIDARRALPCFDEPDMKAKFNLRIITDEKYTALSNTQVVDIINKIENKVEYVFAETPIMSTYLLAWSIGKFECITKASNSGTIVNIYTPLGKKHLGDFALKVAPKVLDFFEDYFGIPYPLEKLDLLALPDFASGAMENWGLITFRETCLLVDKNHTSFQNTQWIALVIAHEIAHQWFGNLVTMAWWDDLWLNEGFANYIEYTAIDAIFPKWKVWEKFTHGDMGSALRLDALKSSHPIQVPILDAHNIDEVFDDITYRKGASVIRMLAEYVGEKNFQIGISKYLKANSYKNATTHDLWRHLEKVSGKEVEKVMSIWTKSAGFPVVTLAELNLKKNNSQTKTGIRCTQCRYYRNRNIMAKNKDNKYWPIPIDDGNKTYLLQPKKTSNLEIKNDIYTLNAEESNLVYIDYTPQFIERQIKALENKKINDIQRMGLVRNMRGLCESGLASTVELLDFLKLFKNEKNHIVIGELWGSMQRIDNVFNADLVVKNDLRKLYLNIFENIWIYFNWNDTNNHNKIRSSLILNMAYKLGYEKIIKDAIEKFRSPIQNIPAHLRSSVYYIIVRYGDENDNMKLWGMLENETLHEEKLRIMTSFSAVLKAKDIIDVLDYYTSDKVRNQDTPLLISRLLGETNHPEIVYNYIEHHWGEFVDKYGKGGHLLAHMLESLAIINDTAILKHMKEFFKKYPARGTKMVLSQVYEKIEGTLAWQKQDQKILKEYLSTKTFNSKV